LLSLGDYLKRASIDVLAGYRVSLVLTVDGLSTLLQLLVVTHNRSSGYADRTFVAHRFYERRKRQDQRATTVTWLYFDC